MNDFSSQFNLYEILRILIPGVLVATNIGIACDILQYTGSLIIQNPYYNGIIFFLTSFIAGLCVYAIDLPKRLPLFRKDLPTTRVKLRHSNINEVKIANSYFTFYDTLSAELRNKTEIYSTFFHFGINLSFSSVSCIIVATMFDFSQLRGLILLNLAYLIATSIISLVIYYSRLQQAFKRNLEAYLNSNEYQTLIRP